MGIIENSAPQPRRPRAWLAAFLTLLQPGLGHLYAWRPRRAIAIWAVAFACVMSGALIVATTPGWWPIALFIAVVLALYLTMSVSAWRTARAQSAPRPRRWILAITLIAFLVAMSEISGFAGRWVKGNVAEAFSIPAVSMEPTLLVGDWLFVRPRKGEPVRDGMYSFKRDGEIFLKRVVGLPGDTLRMEGGKLIRNGRVVEEPYAKMSGAAAGTRTDFEWQEEHAISAGASHSLPRTIDNWGPLIMPPGTVFILGDNRHMSLDGRYTGPTAIDSVLGKPTHVYFSRDPNGGVRWKRIGARLR